MSEKFPHAAGFEFNEVFRYDHSAGGEKLRAFFSYLNVDIELGTRATDVLTEILNSHQNGIPSENYLYRDLAQKALFDAAVAELARRLAFVERHLSEFPLKRVLEQKLYSMYLKTILQDFDPELGFTKYLHGNFSKALVKAREHYLASEEKRLASGPVWYEPGFGLEEPHKPERGSPEAEKEFDTASAAGQGSAFVLPGEKLEDVVKALSEISPNMYDGVVEASVTSFEGIGQVATYQYVVLHRQGGDQEHIVSAYQKGLEFLADRISVPRRDRSKSTNPLTSNEARTKNFILGLNGLLNGDLDIRFAGLKDEAREQLGITLDKLHGAILYNNESRRNLFPDEASQREVNDCFAAVGLDPIDFSD